MCDICFCSATGIIKKSCNGRRSCSLYASNSVFGDPCVGTYKYIWVHYRCTRSGKIYKTVIIFIHFQSSGTVVSLSDVTDLNFNSWQNFMLLAECLMSKVEDKRCPFIMGCTANFSETPTMLIYRIRAVANRYQLAGGCGV